MTAPAILTAETNFRFWKTGFKPGLKLDMSLPEDKAKSEEWLVVKVVKALPMPTRAQMALR